MVSSVGRYFPNEIANNVFCSYVIAVEVHLRNAIVSKGLRTEEWQSVWKLCSPTGAHLSSEVVFKMDLEVKLVFESVLKIYAIQVRVRLCPLAIFQHARK
jgi:hypothetical protein